MPSKDQAHRQDADTKSAVISEGDIANFYSSQEAAKSITGSMGRIVNTALPMEVAVQ